MLPNMIAVENKRVGHHGGVGLKRHTIMSDQYPIPMIHNALNFHVLGFPDKHMVTTGMCNDRLELRRSSTKGRCYGGLTYVRETLRNEAPHWQIIIETLQLYKRGHG